MSRAIRSTRSAMPVTFQLILLLLLRESIALKTVRCCPFGGSVVSPVQHQATRILSMAATRKMRPKINAGNVM